MPKAKERAGYRSKMRSWLVATICLCCGCEADGWSPSVAVCVMGDARTFRSTHMHIYTRMIATGVHIDWYFWMTNGGYNNSKGGAYKDYSDAELRADVACFHPTFVELNATSSFEGKRNNDCTFQGGNKAFDRSGQSIIERIVGTEAKFFECFRRVEAEERRRGQNYTNVIRLRPDIFFFANIDPAILTSSVPIFPNGGHGTTFPAFSGYLAFLPRWAAADYFEIIKTYFGCHGILRHSLNVESFPVYLNQMHWNHTAISVLIPSALVRAGEHVTGCERTGAVWATNHGREAVSMLKDSNPIARRNMQICLDAGGVHGDPTRDVPYDPDPDHIVSPQLSPMQGETTAAKIRAVSPPAPPADVASLERAHEALAARVAALEAKP